MCTPGQFVTAAGTSTTDRSCGACASGNFSATANAASCAPWMSCAAGQFVGAVGTSMSDRMCVACASGAFSATTNAASCTTWATCAAGSYVTAVGTASSNRTCAACASGYTTASNSAACTAWTSCAAGNHIVAAGTTTTDRTCAACAAGTFAAVANQAACAAWTSCGDNFVRTPPSSSSDRVCCAANHVGSDCSYDFTGYQLAYDLLIPTTANGGTGWGSAGAVPYTVNNAVAIPAVGRVAYALELDERNVWTEMDDFTSGRPGETGVPVDSRYQRAIGNLTVRANIASGVTETTNDATGSIHFWSNSYVSNPGTGRFDYGSQPAGNLHGYATMSVFRGTNTQFAFNRWSTAGGGVTDLGIGTGTGTEPDWTFLQNAGGYTYRRLRVFILPTPRVQSNYTWGDGLDQWPVGSGREMDVAADAAGNVYALGTYGSDMGVNGVTYTINRFGGVIVSTTSTGTFRWATNFGAQLAGGGDLSPVRVMYDATSNAIYVSGSGWGGTPTIDSMGNTVHTVIGTQNNQCNPFIARLSVVDGSVVWAHSYLAAGAGCGTGYAVGRASSGEILLAGSIQGSMTMDTFIVSGSGAPADGYVARLNATTGVTTGVFTFGAAAAGETILGVAGLPSGNIAVAGRYDTAAANIGGTVLPFGGNTDGFWGEFTSAGAGLFAGSLSGANADEFQDVRVGPSGDFYVAGDYDTSATIGATTLSGNSFGSALARINASTGAYTWITGGLGGGNAQWGLRRIVVDPTETVRFAVNTSAAAMAATGLWPSTLAGAAIPNFANMRIARVSGATGVATNVETISGVPNTAINLALAVLPDGRAVMVGYHASVFTIDGVSFNWSNTTCCTSRDQFLAVLRPGL